VALTINHNLMSLNTARNLSDHYGKLGVSTRRLSSGLRVGTAADDAAGLAVRELMRADVTTISQGVRNANDAISAVQVADGALQIIDEKLIRLKELAEQAATGTYTSDQRLIIDSEFQAMASEIQRIAMSTKFNGIGLIDGSMNQVQTLNQKINQSGFGLNPLVNRMDYGLIELNGSIYCSDRAGNIWHYDGGTSWTNIATGLPAGIKTIDKWNGNIVCGILTGTGVGIYKYDGSSWAQINTNGFGDPNNFGMDSFSEVNGDLYAAAHNNVSGVEIYKYNSGTSWTKINSNGFGDVNNNNANLTSFSGDLYASTWNTNGTEVYKYSGGTSWEQVGAQGLGKDSQALSFSVLQGQLYGGSASPTGAVMFRYRGPNDWEQINQDGFGAGVTGSTQIVNFNNELYVGVGGMNPGDVGGVYKYSGKGDWTEINDNGLGNTDNRQIKLWSTSNTLYATTFNPTDGVEVFKYLQKNDNSIEIQFGTQNRENIDNYDLPSIDARTGTTGLNIQDLSVNTQDNAQYSLDRIGKAIVVKDQARAALGAIQNRLSNTISNLQIQGENLQAAESRISDADVAQEMTEFTKEQILTQAATAMLAQANSLPKMALQLIQGG